MGKETMAVLMDQAKARQAAQKKYNRKLVDAWVKLYDEQAEEIEAALDHGDFESVCVGWCLGKGMPLDTAVEFYQDMILCGKL